jgi:hypothetical protein
MNNKVYLYGAGIIAAVVIINKISNGKIIKEVVKSGAEAIIEVPFDAASGFFNAEVYKSENNAPSFNVYDFFLPFTYSAKQTIFNVQKFKQQGNPDKWFS